MFVVEIKLTGEDMTSFLGAGRSRRGPGEAYRVGTSCAGPLGEGYFCDFEVLPSVRLERIVKARPSILRTVWNEGLVCLGSGPL